MPSTPFLAASNPVACLGETSAQPFEIDLIVFDDQDFRGVGGRRRSQTLRRQIFIRCRDFRQDGVENTAAAARTFDPDLAALRFDDLLGEREPEPGALMSFAGAGIQLLKRDKKSLRLVGHDADARVFDFQPEVVAVLGARAHADVALLGGEFDRIREIVVENLLEFCRIDDDLLDLLSDRDSDRQPLVGREWLKNACLLPLRVWRVVPARHGIRACPTPLSPDRGCH